MKNIFNKFAFFIALSFVFISCGNLTTSENDDSIPQGKGKITISTDLQNGRSVLPTAIEETTTGLKWELVGIKDGTQQIIESWTDGTDETGTVTVTAYQSMTSDSKIVIDTGTWEFTLTTSLVSDDGSVAKVLVSEIVNATIKSGENKLNFVMQEATENAASGSIEFTLNFPKDVVDNVEATLYKYDNANNVVDTNRQLTINNLSDDFDSVKYSYPDATGTTSSPLSAGYYILKIELQQDTSVQATATDYQPINTYSCLIRVAPGLLSQGKYTLPDLAQLYTIKYECGRGNIENQLITTSYNAYTSFALPEPTYQGHYFAGWYTDAELKNPVELDENDKYRIKQDTTLYAKYVKAYEFNLYDSVNNEVYDGYKVEKGIGSITLSNKGDSVWDYYLKSKSTDIEFTEKNNYKITVEMKAEADSVVAIQAANSDMFFTVGTEWTPCTMETGFIEKELDSSRKGISFGLGLSQKTYFKNLVIEPISSDDDGLPTLVFDITTEGINQYLNTQNKADKIIEVKKVVDASGMATGYAITINAPLSHKDENNVVQQNVKLHLRDYAKSVGANNVSFEVKNTGSNPFATSFMADTASNNSMAWNNVRTEVVSANSCNIDFPNYIENDELTVDVITGSSVAYQNYPVKFTISEFKVEEPVATAGPFNGKIFAIQVGETWTQEKSVEVTIPANNNIEFDVGMFNGWNSNMPSSFDDVTRFFYTDGTGNSNITDNLIYSVNNDNPNEPKYSIKNNSSSDVKVKITLDADYKVQIKEVENQPIDLTVDSLKNYLEPNNNLYRLPTGEYRVTDNLTLSYPIYIDSYSTVKIYADDNVEITPAFTTGPMINLPMSTNSTLTLGGGNGTLTLKGTGVSIGSVISSNTSLIIEDGFKLIDCDVCAINVTSGTFTMNGGEITDISREGHIINIAGGTAIFNGGSIYNNECVDMRGTSYCIYVDTGTLNIPSNSTALIYKNYSSISAGEYDTEKGAFIYNNKGTVTILGSDLAKGTCYEEPINSGGNEPLEGTEVNSLSALQAAINGDDEVIIITSNITITDPLVINKKIKICTSDSNYQLVRATEGTVEGPMFEVTSNGELTLQNIIITGGYDNGYEAAVNNPFIYNNGKTVIENSTLKNNYLYYTSAYTNNESNSIHFVGGGAIFSNGDLTINNSSMENFYINSSGGGTIYIESGTCNIDRLTISGCTATKNGGGIYAAAGTININNSEINNNSAKNGKSVYFKKGVIYSINGNTPVTVSTTSGYNEDITPSTSSISIN